MAFKLLSVGVAGACLGAIAACASQGERPTTELTRAHTIVEQADRGNAQRYAAADLSRAQNELDTADRAAADGKYEEARWAAERAQVDGNLANARGSRGAAQKSAEEVTQGVNSLKQESQRASPDSGTDRE